MPDIIAQPQTPSRSPVSTRLRLSTLAASALTQQHQNLARRKRALAKEIHTLDSVIMKKKQEQSALFRELQLAETHITDDERRIHYLSSLIIDTSRRSQIEQLTQTDIGQRNDTVERILHEYERNRPYDIETIERLRTEMYSLHDAMFEKTQALLTPLEQERDLAQRNYDESSRLYSNLAQQLDTLSLLIQDLTQTQTDLVRQSDELNIGGGNRQRQIKRQGQTKRQRQTKRQGQIKRQGKKTRK